MFSEFNVLGFWTGYVIILVAVLVLWLIAKALNFVFEQIRDFIVWMYRRGG